MANFVYTRAKFNLGKGTIDFDTPDDFRVILVMDTTTADTEEDTDFIGNFTTLAECDGAGYARVALTSETYTEDTANDRAEFSAANVAFGAVSVSATPIQALLLYKHVTNDADSIPIAFIDTVSSGVAFPITANGGTITIVWNAEGIIQIT